MLIDRRNRVLIAQRPAGKALAGAWEFPGGKLEPAESPREALAREIAEELGLTIRDPRPLMRLKHSYDHAQVLLDVFVVRRYAGQLEARDDQSLKWVRRAELHREPLLPADRPILRLLRLPERLESAATRAYHVLRQGSAALARKLGGGAREGAASTPLLGVLCRSMDELRAAAAQAASVAAPAGSAAPEGPIAVPAGSAVVPAGSVAAGGLPPDAAACEARRIDFLVLATRCTDEELAALCAALAVPLYVPARTRSLERAWALGASGVHAIV